MARFPGAVASPQDTAAIDLSRMIARLQNILVTPDSGTETKLRASSYEREKVGNVSKLQALFEEIELLSDDHYRTLNMPGHSSYD